MFQYITVIPDVADLKVHKMNMVFNPAEIISSFYTFDVIFTIVTLIN